MPWNETDPMNERVKFIARYLQNDESFIVLCEDAGISRKTGYKWVERYEDGGVVALVDRSRPPRSHPHAVPSAVLEALRTARTDRRRSCPVVDVEPADDAIETRNRGHVTMSPVFGVTGVGGRTL